MVLSAPALSQIRNKGIEKISTTFKFLGRETVGVYLALMKTYWRMYISNLYLVRYY
jgi:hypothetical protein